MSSRIVMTLAVLGVVFAAEPAEEPLPPAVAPIFAPVLTYKAGAKIELQIDMQNPSETEIRYLPDHGPKGFEGVYRTEILLFSGIQVVEPKLHLEVLRVILPGHIRAVPPGGRVPLLVNVTDMFGELAPGEYTLKVRCEMGRVKREYNLTPLSSYRTVAFLQIK